MQYIFVFEDSGLWHIDITFSYSNKSFKRPNNWRLIRNAREACQIATNYLKTIEKTITKRCKIRRLGDIKQGSIKPSSDRSIYYYIFK